MGCEETGDDSTSNKVWQLVSEPEFPDVELHPISTRSTSRTNDGEGRPG
jgi:hypothetical protein